jgi:hypothetical protein
MVPAAFQGREDHEQIGGAITLIFVIHPCGMARVQRERLTPVGEQLV